MAHEKDKPAPEKSGLSLKPSSSTTRALLWGAAMVGFAVASFFTGGMSGAILGGVLGIAGSFAGYKAVESTIQSVRVHNAAKKSEQEANRQAAYRREHQANVTSAQDTGQLSPGTTTDPWPPSPTPPDPGSTPPNLANNNNPIPEVADDIPSRQWRKKLADQAQRDADRNAGRGY